MRPISPSQVVTDSSAPKPGPGKVIAAEPRSFASPDEEAFDDTPDFPPGAGIETLWRDPADHGGPAQRKRRGWLGRVFR